MEVGGRCKASARTRTDWNLFANLIRAPLSSGGTVLIELRSKGMVVLFLGFSFVFSLPNSTYLFSLFCSFCCSFVSYFHFSFSHSHTTLLIVHSLWVWCVRVCICMLVLAFFALAVLFLVMFSNLVRTHVERSRKWSVWRARSRIMHKISVDFHPLIHCMDCGMVCFRFVPCSIRIGSFIFILYHFVR